MLHAPSIQALFQRDDAGRLIVAGHDVQSVIDQYLCQRDADQQSAYFMASDVVCRQADAVIKQLQRSNTRPTYAIKANYNPHVLRLLQARGIGAEVASVEELRYALAAGFLAKDIVVDGVGKHRAYFHAALAAGVPVINCNDASELQCLNTVAGDMGRRPRVGLRVAPGVEAGETYHIQTGDDSSKFGVTIAQAKAAFLEHQYPNIDLVGIHVHLGSNIRKLSQFDEGYGRVGALIHTLEAAGHRLQYLDLGGGVGVPYNVYGALHLPLHEKDQGLVSIEAYGELLLKQRQLHPNIELISELGRYYVAPALMYVCRVTGVSRKGSFTHILTTGKMSDQLRSAMYGAPHIAVPIVERSSAAQYPSKTSIAGCMCESDDVVVPEAAGMREVAAGDWVAVMNVGAYCPSMQMPGYNLMGSCGTIEIAENTPPRWIERPVTGEQWLALKQV